MTYKNSTDKQLKRQEEENDNRQTKELVKYRSPQFTVEKNQP